MANIHTPEFKVSWPKVFKPELNELSGKMEYSVVALFPKGADLSKLKAAAKALVEEKWGTDQSKWPKKADGSPGIRLPFKKQSLTRLNKEGKTVDNPGHEEGAEMMDFKTTAKPGVVDQNVQPILSEAEFYAGCFAVASVRPFYYDTKGNRGVSFGLQNIQKTKEGDPLSGRARPETEFAPIAGTETSNTNDMFS